MLEWERLPAPSTQRGRFGHSATAVSGGSKILVLGGQYAGCARNDLWEFDVHSESWRQLQEDAPIDARAYHTATLVGRNQLWIIGGMDKAIHDDVHVLNTDTLEWSTPALRSPGFRRTYHAAVLHPVNPKCILVFGGFGGGSGSFDWLGDLSVLNTETLEWSVLQPEGFSPSSRGRHSFTACGNKVVLFGGYHTTGLIRDEFLSVYDASENRWLRVKPSGESPCSRANHAAVLARETNIVFHGGYDDCFGHSILKDTYSLEIARGDVYKWHKLYSRVFDNGIKSKTLRTRSKRLKTAESLDVPEGRAKHCLVVCNNALYMLGGYRSKSGIFSVYVLRSLTQEDLNTDYTLVVATKPDSAAPMPIPLQSSARSELSSASRDRDDEGEVRQALQGEMAAAQAGMARVSAELAMVEFERQHLQWRVDKLQEQVGTRASSSQNGEASGTSLDPKQDLLPHLRYVESGFERCKDCIRMLDSELQKQKQAVQLLRSKYDMEYSFLFQDVAEKKESVDRMSTELGLTKESCRTMHEHVTLLTNHLEKANEKLDRQRKEREGLGRSNAALRAELNQVKIARDTAEANSLLLRKELESTTNLLGRFISDAMKTRENGEEGMLQ